MSIDSTNSVTTNKGLSSHPNHDTTSYTNSMNFTTGESDCNNQLLKAIEETDFLSAKNYLDRGADNYLIAFKSLPIDYITPYS